MNAVNAVGIDVVGKPAGATDPGDEREVLLGDAYLGQHLLDLREDGIVATAWAPSYVLSAGKILRGQRLQFNIGGHGVLAFHNFVNFVFDLINTERFALHFAEGLDLDKELTLKYEAQLPSVEFG